ncbi:hypothetical protein HaLaN_23566, partial [Haematococcus lacustris]
MAGVTYYVASALHAPWQQSRALWQHPMPGGAATLNNVVLHGLLPACHQGVADWLITERHLVYPVHVVGRSVAAAAGGLDSTAWFELGAASIDFTSA